MDLENFSRSDIKRHLAELGYSNITEEKLDSFVRYLVLLWLWSCSMIPCCFLLFWRYMATAEFPLFRDLRKLIKYEERKKEVQHKLDEFDEQHSVKQSKVMLEMCPFNTCNSLVFISCSGAWHIHFSRTGGKAASQNSKKGEKERWEGGGDDEA